MVSTLSRPDIAALVFGEDFDLPARAPVSAPVAAPGSPACEDGPDGALPVETGATARWTEADLEEAIAIARDEGRALGHAEAVSATDAAHGQAVARGLAALDGAAALVREHAAAATHDLSATVLTLLLGFLPCLAERHAADQTRLVLHELCASLFEASQIVVRLHPAVIAELQARMPETAGVSLVLEPDATLPVGDIRAAWRNGAAARRTATLRNRIHDALVEARLLDPDAAPPPPQEQHRDH